jgi:ferric-dicitrate binding protein FerR (iron transport regulator)
MTDQELLEAFLDGELDDAGWAELELLVSSMPQVLHELAALRTQGQALGAVLGDGRDEERVKRAVLGDLRGKPLEQFKTDLLEKVRAEELRKKRAEEAALPAIREVPRETLPSERPAREALRFSRRRWPRALAAAAAALAVATGIYALVRTPSEPPGFTAAYLLGASPGAQVCRAGAVLPARGDMALEAGDRVRVDDGAEVRIGFTIDPTRLVLRGPADLCLARGGRRKRADLVRGEVEALVPPGTEGDPLLLVTPHSETRLADGQVKLIGAAASARLEVRRGWAVFRRTRDGQSVRVGAEHYAVAGEGVPLVALAVRPEDPPEAVPSRPVVASLARVQGDVYLLLRGSPERKRAEPGQRLTSDHGLQTEGAASLAVVEYLDATRLEIGADTTLRAIAADEPPGRKSVAMEQGILTADVVKQAADQPMEIATPHASVRVLGTRFVLAGERDATRVQVEEGAVRFTSVRERRSIEVRSGWFASAGEGIPLQALPIPGGPRYLEIDLASGRREGDGAWSVDGRSVRQADPRTPGSLNLFKVSADKGVLLETVVRLDPVSAREAWGFGLAVGFGPRRLVLRSHQGGPGGSVFEFQDAHALPFEHGREGVYRLKLQVERRREGPALLRGKIWQGEREPDGWMIEHEAALEGPLTEAGFQAVRCACTFSRFRVEVLRDDAN